MSLNNTLGVLFFVVQLLNLYWSQVEEDMEGVDATFVEGTCNGGSPFIIVRVLLLVQEGHKDVLEDQLSLIFS